MAILKSKEIAKLTEKELNDKLKELKMELIKNQVGTSKGGKVKTREIKKTIARILTFSRLNKSKKTK